MALWLVRAGKFGQHETRFFEDGRVYLTWGALTGTDLSTASNYEGIKTLVGAQYPDEPTRRLGNWAGQIWAFVLAMKPGDWVVVPRKSTGTIAVGEVKSAYTFDPSGLETYRHFRQVQWLNTDVPRSAFDQDLLYSIGAIMTVCEIKRNDAEKRIRAMATKGWHGGSAVVPTAQTPVGVDNEPEDLAEVDLEQLARDAIAKLIEQKFKGHAMARLVEAILQAQGFATFRSPEGPDKGVDILAAAGALGFDRPRICVQVKSGDTPTDRPEFTQLIGAMQGVGAEQGLFVAWGGFKPTVLKEVPLQFFKVRLWNRNDLIEQLLIHYDRLDQDVRAELPLKRVWMVASTED